MKLALGLEYDGSKYSGWQKQDLATVKTVEGELMQAISFVAGHSVELTVAGRTDAGVHACNQVVHFETSAKRSEYSWVHGINSQLKKNGISVNWAMEVPDNFNARFDALARRYQYIIYNHKSSPGLLYKNVTWANKELDIKAMQEAANYLIGEHDFSSFRAAGCQSNTPIRELFSFKIKKQGKLIILDIIGNAFLYHMVRNIAGFLIKVGQHDISASNTKELLAARNRTLLPATAPPNGLYLVNIRYNASLNLPEVNSPWFINTN